VIEEIAPPDCASMHCEFDTLPNHRVSQVSLPVLFLLVVERESFSEVIRLTCLANSAFLPDGATYRKTKKFKIRIPGCS
jgi:hypothetical protein